MLAGLFYLLITVPLTHLVNHIDKRLREGSRPVIEPEAPSSVNQAGALV